MFDTETVTTTTRTCDICNSVVDSFCTDSLVDKKNQLLKNSFEDEDYPNYDFKIGLAISLKRPQDHSFWHLDEHIDICQNCFDSIQKHLVGLAKKEK